VKLQQKLGDDLQVIFVECQGANRDRFEAFAWAYKWMGNRAMWTDERLIPPKSNGLPETALIGVDGTIVMQGNPMALGKKLEDAITAEVKKTKDAPDGTPKELVKPWTTFAHGDVAAAIAECEKIAAATPAVADAASAMKAEIASRTKAKIDRAKWLLDNGYVGEAETLLSALAKATKGYADLADKVAEQTTRLASESIASERDASKALAALTDKMSDKGKPFEDGNVKSLQRIADKYKGTKTADRAAHLVALSKINLNKD
jgi:hypothetical protein